MLPQQPCQPLSVVEEVFDGAVVGGALQAAGFSDAAAWLGVPRHVEPGRAGAFGDGWGYRWQSRLLRWLCPPRGSGQIVCFFCRSGQTSWVCGPPDFPLNRCVVVRITVFWRPELPWLYSVPRRRRASGRPPAHRAYPGVDLQRQRAGPGVRAVADVVGRFDRPPFRIVDLAARRPQPFDDYLGHARSVAVPGALQVSERGLDIARRKALVQTPLPGARLLVAGELRWRPAVPVVRVVLRARRRRPSSPAPPGRPAGRGRAGSPSDPPRRPPPHPRSSRPAAGTTPRRKRARRRCAAGFRSRPRRATSPRGRRGGCGGVHRFTVLHRSGARVAA